MRPSKHMASGFIIGIPLIFLWGIVEGVSFILATIFIDVDHVVLFLGYTKYKSLNIVRVIRKAYEFCDHPVERKRILDLLILHTIEFLLFIKMLDILIKNDFISAGLSGIFWGATLHILCDFMCLVKIGKFDRVFSFTEYFIRKRLIRRQR